MNKKIVTLIILAIFYGSAKAQIDINFSLQRFDQRTNDNFDIENNYLYTNRSNSAFIHYQNIKDSLKLKNIITTDIFKKNNEGMYYFYEGDNSFGKKIVAGGENVIKKMGTLFGSVSFTRHEKDNISQNYIANPKEYLPYIIGDTISKGKVYYKDYGVSTGYGFNYNNFSYGLGLTYNGKVSYKLNDPRFSSYLAELKLNLGVLAEFKNHIYSFHISPKFDRQNIAVKNFGKSTPDYLLFYGLGQWNFSESIGSNTYASLRKINGSTIDFSYGTKLKSNKKFNYLFNLNYKFNKMSSLERENKILFESKNKYFSYNFLLINKHDKYDFHLLLNGTNRFQKGKENIYEYRQLSSNQLYDDFFKVASNKFYRYSSFLNSISFKFIYKFNTNNTLHILSKLATSGTKEKYLYPKKEILIDKITPVTGIGYHSIFGKNNLFFNINFSQQNNLKSNFDLPFVKNPVFINQTLIPYLLDSTEKITLNTTLQYSYDFKNIGQIGFKISTLYTKKTDQNNILFGINNKHKSLYGVMKFFYIF